MSKLYHTILSCLVVCFHGGRGRDVLSSSSMSVHFLVAHCGKSRPHKKTGGFCCCWCEAHTSLCFSADLSLGMNATQAPGHHCVAGFTREKRDDTESQHGSADEGRMFWKNFMVDFILCDVTYGSNLYFISLDDSKVCSLLCVYLYMQTYDDKLIKMWTLQNVFYRKLEYQ